MNRTALLIALFLAVAATGCSDGNSSPVAVASQGPEASSTIVPDAMAPAQMNSPALGLLTAGRPKVYRLKGTADVVEVNGKLCYTVDLWDVEQNRIVGEATDCLFDIDDSDPTGVVLTAQTTFDFGKGNSFTSEGRTSVRPTMPGSSLAFTHITGAIPPEDSNSVIDGTGRFDGFEATVRLSGAVNLSAFPATTTFDCLFSVTPV